MKENSRLEKLKQMFPLRMAKYSDFWIHLAMILLMVSGFFVSGSAAMSEASGIRLVISFVKSGVFLTVGYLAMTAMSRKFKLSFLNSYNFMWLILATAALLIACLFFPGSGGSKAWISISIAGTQITLQPSEFAKIMAVLIVASYCGDLNKRALRTHRFLILPLSYCMAYVGIILLLQKDMGSAMVVFMLTCIAFLIPEVKDRKYKLFQYFLRAGFVFIVGLLIYTLTDTGAQMIQNSHLATYQKYRFLSAVNPFIDRYNTGYNLSRGLIAYASGGVGGVGYGGSVVKFMNFPACTNDFVSAVMYEELGFLGFGFIMAFYGIVIFRLIYYAFLIHSEKARIILIGTAMYFMIHIFFNIGGATGMIPLTGIPLLLISAGGSSTVSIMMAVGISQSLISSYRRGVIQ